MSTNETAALPELPRHPESHAWTWTALEKRAILEYGQRCMAAGAAQAAPAEPQQAPAAPAQVAPSNEDIDALFSALDMIFEIPQDETRCRDIIRRWLARYGAQPAGYVLAPACVEQLAAAARQHDVDRVTFGVLVPQDVPDGVLAPSHRYVGIVSESVDNLLDPPDSPAQPAGAQGDALVERIAAGWDGCMYNGPGGYIDIGRDIRAQAAREVAK